MHRVQWIHLFIDVCPLSAGDTTRHILILTDLNQGSNVLILDCSLAAQFVESAPITAISHTLILEITFASLVTNGAIEGMVGKQKLHDTFSCLVYEWRICLDFHTGLYRPCAGGDWLGCSFDFD